MIGFLLGLLRNLMDGKKTTASGCVVLAIVSWLAWQQQIQTRELASMKVTLQKISTVLEIKFQVPSETLTENKNEPKDEP